MPCKERLRTRGDRFWLYRPCTASFEPKDLKTGGFSIRVRLGGYQWGTSSSYQGCVPPERHQSSIDFRNSLVPAGPVICTVTGPISGSAANSNLRKGQHSRSAAINSAATASDFLSPGMRKR